MPQHNQPQTNKSLEALHRAEANASELFREAEERGMIKSGQSEKDLNLAFYNLAYELFGIRKYWHKRIIRAGKNTLLPYAENPDNLIIQEDDILFVDFGPVFDEWEADFGRTYVLGSDTHKLKLKNDVATAWLKGQEFYLQNQSTITAAELYNFTCNLAKQYGWQYGNEHCGHLVGNFPHEQIIGDEQIHYLHPNNHSRMSDYAPNGQIRHWIYEIHFVDKALEIGGFFEQLLH